MIRRATLDDLALTIQLEERFFSDATHKPEVSEAYKLVLESGTVDLGYRAGVLEGMLALVPIDRLYVRKEEVLALPKESPLRERFERGYLSAYRDRQFVHAFVSEHYSPDLTRVFREQERMVGFVPTEEVRALTFYRRVGCTEDGVVQNIHDPEKQDTILLYTRK